MVTLIIKCLVSRHYFNLNDSAKISRSNQDQMKKYWSEIPRKVQDRKKGTDGENKSRQKKIQDQSDYLHRFCFDIYYENSKTHFVYIKQFCGPRYCPRGLTSDWIFFLTDDLKLNKVTRQETGYFAYYHVLSFQNGDVNKFPYRYLSCFNHQTQWGQNNVKLHSNFPGKFLPKNCKLHF